MTTTIKTLAVVLLGALLLDALATTASAQAIAGTAVVENPCPSPPVPPAELAGVMQAMLQPEAADPSLMANFNSSEAAASYFKALSELRLHDWAELCRYRAENAALPDQRARVVFMGDSITDFWVKAQPELFANGVVDRGISGQTTPQMLVRFYADVIALRPRVVHIMAGTNDLAGNTGPSAAQDYKNNIMAMCELARTHGVRVILASILPSDSFSWRPDLKPAAGIRELNSWLRSYAAEHKLVYVDYYSALSTSGGGMRPEFSHDGVHPHRGGYSVMKPLAERAIRQALK